MIDMLLSLLVLAGPPARQVSLFDELIAAKTCRTGKELGLDTSSGESQTTYCRFDLPGLSFELSGVGEEGVSLTVYEQDPKLFKNLTFAPFQACFGVVPKERGRGVAVVHMATAKVFRNMKECLGRQ